MFVAALAALNDMFRATFSTKEERWQWRRYGIARGDAGSVGTGFNVDWGVDTTANTCLL